MVIALSDFVILTDTRQQKQNHIIKTFDKQQIVHISTKLDSADYMALRFQNNNFLLDYNVLIDTKKDLLEVANNLCHSSEHQRVVKEIERAQQLGCKKFIFLIGENKIKNVDDIINWSSPYTSIKGSTLFKVMKTFSAHHQVKFVIVPKKQMGSRIIELLTEK